MFMCGHVSICQQMSGVSKLDDREVPFTTCCATSKSPRNCELNGGPIRLGSQVVLVLVICRNVRSAHILEPS